MAAARTPLPRLKRRLQPRRLKLRRRNRRRLKLRPRNRRRLKLLSKLSSACSHSKAPRPFEPRPGCLCFGRCAADHRSRWNFCNPFADLCVFKGAAIIAPTHPSSPEGEMEVSPMKSRAINALVLTLAGLALLGCDQNTTPAPAPTPGPQVTPPPAEPPPPLEPPPAEPPPPK